MRSKTPPPPPAPPKRPDVDGVFKKVTEGGCVPPFTVLAILLVPLAIVWFGR